MVESLGKDLESNTKPCSLDIAESLSQCVRPEVSLEMDRLRPGFDHLVDPLDRDGLASSAACKQKIAVFGIRTGQITL